MKTFRNLSIFLTFTGYLLFNADTISAWTNHTIGTYVTISEMPELKNAAKVKVESFEDFIKKESKGLAKLLQEQEEFAVKNFKNYPARPDSLIFTGDEKENVRKKFLMAMRLNPEIKIAYFIQENPGSELSASRKINTSEITVNKDLEFLNRLAYAKIQVNDMVSPISVIASAADEPDYGHDLRLYTDSDSDYGKIYNFGTQPFGDSRFEYSSQAPFHMGFYNESTIVYAAGSFLKKTMPEWRVYQFMGLAKFAFKTGHPYWGHRFMGWGLHYIQDLTQPYHSTVLPGKSSVGMIWINMKAKLGFDKDKTAASERVATRHTCIEHYQYEFLENLLINKHFDHPMVKAYTDPQKDQSFPAFDYKYARNVVSKDSNSKAADFDEKIGDWKAILKFLKNETRYTDLTEDEKKEGEDLNNYLQDLIKSFGAHTRNYIRGVMKD